MDKIINFTKTFFWLPAGAPNPIGLFIFTWFMSLVPFFIYGQTDKSMEITYYIGGIGTLITIASYIYLVIRKHFKRIKK